MAKYNGLTFKPYREFTEKERNMSLSEMDVHFRFSWDFELGMFDSENVHGNLQKFPYSHESFYENMGEDDWADIYFCEESEQYYVPSLHTMMKIERNIRN